MAKLNITKKQFELLELLSRGPRYGFTNLSLINALIRKGLARKNKTKNMVGEDYVITAAGLKLLPPPRKFDQSTSQDNPGFVETFRVCS